MTEAATNPTPTSTHSIPRQPPVPLFRLRQPSRLYPDAKLDLSSRPTSPYPFLSHHLLQPSMPKRKKTSAATRAEDGGPVTATNPTPIARPSPFPALPRRACPSPLPAQPRRARPILLRRQDVTEPPCAAAPKVGTRLRLSSASYKNASHAPAATPRRDGAALRRGSKGGDRHN